MRLNDDINIKSFFDSIISELKPIGDIVSFSSGTVTTTKTSGFKYQGETLESADLKNGDYVTINDVDYIVRNVTDTTFNITATDIGAATTWKKSRPFYLYNHPQVANNQWTLDLNENNTLKTPFVGIFTPFDISDDWNTEVVEASTFTPWVVFMNDVNYEQFSDEEHQDVIAEMNKIYRDFIYILKCNKYVVNRDSLACTRVQYRNWGLIARTRGTESQLFNGHLSGIEINDLEIKIKKTYEKCN